MHWTVWIINLMDIKSKIAWLPCATSREPFNELPNQQGHSCSSSLLSLIMANGEFFLLWMMEHILYFFFLNFNHVAVNGKAVEQCFIKQAFLPLPIYVLILFLSLLSVVCLVGLIFTLKKLAAYKKLAPFSFGIYRWVAATLFHTFTQLHFLKDLP